MVVPTAALTVEQKVQPTAAPKARPASTMVVPTVEQKVQPTAAPKARPGCRTAEPTAARSSS
jgi:hypothetical protein